MDMLYDFWNWIKLKMSLSVRIIIFIGIAVTILYEVIRKLPAFELLNSKEADSVAWLIVWSIVLILILLRWLIEAITKSPYTKLKKEYEKQLNIKEAEKTYLNMEIKNLYSLSKEQEKTIKLLNDKLISIGQQIPNKNEIQSESDKPNKI